MKSIWIAASMSAILAACGSPPPEPERATGGALAANTGQLVNTLFTDPRYGLWVQPPLSPNNPCAGLQARVLRETTFGTIRSSSAEAPLTEMWRTQVQADGSLHVVSHWFGDGPVNMQSHDGSLPPGPFNDIRPGTRWEHEFTMISTLSGMPTANANPPGRWRRVCTALSWDNPGQLAVECQTTIGGSGMREERFVWQVFGNCPVPVRYHASGPGRATQSWQVSVRVPDESAR